MDLTDNEEMNFFLTGGSYVYNFMYVIQGFHLLFHSKLNHAFWLLLSFNLLEDWRKDDVIITNMLFYYCMM